MSVGIFKVSWLSATYVLSKMKKVLIWNHANSIPENRYVNVTSSSPEDYLLSTDLSGFKQFILINLESTDLTLGCNIKYLEE